MIGLAAVVLVGLALSQSFVRGYLQSVAGPAKRTADPTPVVLIIFDELPLVSMLDEERAIDDQMFPGFARLASRTTWFRNATTLAPLTSDAVPSILTGLDPDRLSLLLGGPVPQSIFTLLGDSHDILASRAFPTLCHVEVCTPTPRVESSLPPPLDVFGAAPRGDSLVYFLDEMERVDGPCLCVLHLVMPHSPWRYLPTGQLYPGTRPLPGHIETPGPGRKWRDDEWLVRLSHHRHMLQAVFADRILATVVDSLERHGLFQEAVVAVLADHGIAFTPEFPKRAATPLTAGDVAHVPLFVKMPHQQDPDVVDDPVELIDVVPTITRALRVSGELDLDGIDLFDPVGGRNRRMGPVELDPGGADLERALERKLEKFSSVKRWQDLFSLAPSGTEGFLGQIVEEVVVDSDTTASVVDLADLEKASARDRLLPALVKGQLSGGGAAATELLALAVDGRVAAVTRSYVGDDGERRFYAMVPPWVLRRPPHTVDVLRIEPDGALTRLSLTPG